MYIPPNTVTLDKVSNPQIRLGIQGYPGTGKTWAALTFPNPVVVNLDRGLGAHSGRKDVIEVPIWDKTFCRTINPNYGNSPSVTIKDILELWLDKEAKKLEADQTLIIDGNTGIQSAYHQWYNANPVVTKQGKIDDFGEWRLKLNFFGTICDTLKLLRCHVVYIAHESEKKDKGGEYTGKIRPLLRGQFCDELGGHFTDWVRALAFAKPKPDALIADDKLRQWGMDKSEQFIEMCELFPGNTVYAWQLESDDIFDGKVSSLVKYPKYIPASYDSFKKYMRGV